MKPIKTGLVVVVMLVVVYGVWQMINKKPIGPPAELAAWTDEFNVTPTDGIPTITPPNVQGPGAGAAAPGGPAPVMPQLTVPPSLTPPPTQPNPAVGRSHSHDPHHGHGAPVVAPRQPAPVVGPNDIPIGAYAGASRVNPPASVYGQPAPHEGAPPTSAWSDGDAAGGALANSGFDAAWTRVQEQLARGELAAALAELSVWYGSGDIPNDKQQAMIELLDQLAGAVVYSREHLLEQPYEVRPGETLQDIALAYQIPWQLLANINGITDPSLVTPGTPLKVVRGPFNALISLDRQELTLIVDGRYAGRFAIALGNDPAPRSGEFNVHEKATEKQFINRDGQTIPPGDAANPYGPYWIGLDGPMGIHGAPAATALGARVSTGSIIVSPEDARDLFAILSEDSRVIIRR